MRQISIKSITIDTKPTFTLLNWFNFSKIGVDFLYYYLKQCTTNNSQKTLSFNCGSNRLSCYDWWKNLFLINWWKKNIWWHLKDYGKITRNDYGDDYTTGCILGYTYFKKLYKMMEKDLCENQKLNKKRCNQKDLIQKQYKKLLNLDRSGNATIFLIFEEAKKTVLDCLQRKLLQ